MQVVLELILLIEGVDARDHFVTVQFYIHRSYLRLIGLLMGAHQLSQKLSKLTRAQKIGGPARFEITRPSKSPSQPHALTGEDGFCSITLENELRRGGAQLRGGVTAQERQGRAVDTRQKFHVFYHSDGKPIVERRLGRDEFSFAGEDAWQARGVFGDDKASATR